MDKVAEALGPWPILQLFFGTAVLGVGVFAIIRGLANSKTSDRASVEEDRERWEAYRRLESIDEGIKAIVAHQRLTLEHIRMVGDVMRAQTEQLKALSAAIWNRGV